jgi:hypothetical protein
VPSFSGMKYQLWITHYGFDDANYGTKEPAPTKAPLQDGWMDG